MRHPLVIDIESVPLAASLEMAYPKGERTPPSNYKNEDAIAKWYERDEAAWREERVKECSLNPRLGRVVCLGFTQDGQPDALFARGEIDEYGLLVEFWNLIKQTGGEVVTWNGAFDLRFLVVRSLILGVEPSLPSQTVRSWFARYRTYPHFDCRALLNNWDSYKAGEGLAEWAIALGCPPKAEGISGKDVYPMYQLGHFAEIADYCQQDVAATLAVYHKIAPMFAEAA